MSKKKDGRNRQSRTDMDAPVGRLILKDFYNYQASGKGISPFDPKRFLSEEFWQSREEYRKMPFAAFKAHVTGMAEISKAQMPWKQQQKEKRKHAKDSESDDKTNAKKKSKMGKSKDIESDVKTNAKKKSKMGNDDNLRDTTAAPSLRDTIVAPYPNNNMALVVFELDGNAKKEGSFELEFSSDGRKIRIFSQVPQEMRDAAALVGNDSSTVDQDADCMILDGAIKKRLLGTEEDESGNLWEPREIIQLPFKCHKCLFTKHQKPLNSYLHRTNSEGYGWGYFWVVAAHVGRKETISSTIRGAASSLSSQDSDDMSISSHDDDVVYEQDLKERFQKQQQETDSSHDDDVECEQDLQHKTAGCNQETSSLQDKMDDLKQKVQKQQQEIDRLCQEKQVSQDELKRTQDQHNSTRRQLRELTELNEKQQQEIDRLCQEKQVSQTELKRTQDQHDCTRRQLRELTELKEKQQQEVDQLGRAMEATKEERKQIWGMLEKQKQQKLQFAREKKRLGKLLEGRDHALVDSKNGSIELEERIKELQKVIIDLQETNSRILCTKTECLRGLSEAQSTNKLLETKIKTMRVKQQEQKKEEDRLRSLAVNQHKIIEQLKRKQRVEQVEQAQKTLSQDCEHEQRMGPQLQNERQRNGSKAERVPAKKTVHSKHKMNRRAVRKKNEACFAIRKSRGVRFREQPERSRQ